jgi:tetratricopeptide (TPR) repeat protein
MRKRLVALVLSLGIPAAVLVPFAADAEKPKPKAQADAGEHYDPENVTAISQYMETLVKGNQRADAKDFPGAIDLYKKAAQLKPKDAVAPYLMGEAHLASGNLPEAEAAFKQADELSAADAKNTVVRAQALFVLADVYERQKKWDLAKTAWKAYGEHAEKMKDAAAAHPDSAAARLKAIDEWLALDQKYEIVRQRIAAEKAAAADAGKDAAPAPKK